MGAVIVLDGFGNQHPFSLASHLFTLSQERFPGYLASDHLNGMRSSHVELGRGGRMHITSLAKGDRAQTCVPGCGGVLQWPPDVPSAFTHLCAVGWLRHWRRFLVVYHNRNHNHKQTLVVTFHNLFSFSSPNDWFLTLNPKLLRTLSKVLVFF